MNRWRKSFWRPIYRSDAASFQFLRAEGRGGWIEFRDAGGRYLVPYEVSTGRYAYDIYPEAIVAVTGSRPPEIRQLEIFTQIAEAIREIMRFDVFQMKTMERKSEDSDRAFIEASHILDEMARASCDYLVALSGDLEPTEFYEIAVSQHAPMDGVVHATLYRFFDCSLQIDFN